MTIETISLLLIQLQLFVLTLAIWLINKKIQSMEMKQYLDSIEKVK